LPHALDKRKNFAFSNPVALSPSAQGVEQALNGSELAVPHPNFHQIFHSDFSWVAEKSRENPP